MQNSNLTPEQQLAQINEEERKDILNFRSGMFKLFCNYAKHVAEGADHNTGGGVYPYLVVEKEEINVLVQAYEEADMRGTFRPE